MTTRRILAGVVLLALAGAGGAWLMARDEPAVATVVAAPAASVATAPAVVARPAAASSVAPASSAASAMAVQAAVSYTGLSKAPECGLSEAPTPEVPVVGRKPEPARAGTPRFWAALARVDTLLRTSADPYQRALAAWVDANQTRSPEQRKEQLVLLATGSADPRLYALAYRACHDNLSSQPAACRLVSARQWAQLDQDNAIPWLEVLNEAREAHDDEGVDEALHNAAAASRADGNYFVAAGVIAGLAPEDEDLAPVAAELAIQAAARGMMPAYGGVIQACHDRGQGDPERARTCGQLADLMLEHATDMMAQSIGGALDFQATGDPARRERLQAERAAQSAQAASAAEAASHETACQQVRDHVRMLRRRAEVGEVQAYREELAASPSR